MKRTFTYMVFFICLFTASAQQKEDKLLLPPTKIADSFEFAKSLFKEAKSIGTKDTSKSFTLLRQAANLFKLTGHTLEEGRCFLSIGDLFFEAGNYNRSFANYLKATDTLFEVSQQESYRALLGVAKTQYHRSLYRFAIKSFSEVIEYAIRNNDLELKSLSQKYLGLIYSIYQSPVQSKKYFSNAFTTYQKMNDKKGSLLIAENLYELFYKEKQYDSALWYNDFCLKLANQSQYEHSRALFRLSRINTLIRLNYFTEAKKELDEFDIKRVPISDKNTWLRYEIVRGNYYMGEQKAKAMTHYSAAIQLAEEQNTPDQLGIVYNNMADSYAAINDYKTAYVYTRKYNEVMTNFYSNSINHLSKIEGLFKESISTAEIKYLNSINALKEEKLLREFELRRNLFEESLLKDSLLEKEKLLSTALQRENQSKSKQLATEQQLTSVLHSESNLQKKKLHEEYTLRAILIVGLCSILTLGLITAIQYKRVRSKNKVIQHQSGEVQTLMKEIHHRVKNNLQIISSLLDIQSLNLTDKQAVEAIKEGRNRVQSMAILHQHLYHEGNIRGIKMGDYIITLIQNLFTSYNINPDKISLETDIDNISLDVDTVIPLGLIINELVSNSLKYAFDKNQYGTVRVIVKEKINMIELMVRDTGRGFPVGLNIHNEQTFGLQLINAFAQKLKASIDFFNNDGAVVCMHIKKFRLADTKQLI